MSSSADRAAARRLARQAWPIIKHDLGADAADDLSDTTTAAERIAMMKELAETAWRVSGRALPTYARHEMPGRLFEKGENRPDNDDP